MIIMIRVNIWPYKVIIKFQTGLEIDLFSFQSYCTKKEFSTTYPFCSVMIIYIQRGGGKM